MKVPTLTAVRGGTGITTAMGLLPLPGDYFVAACLAGAIAGVWFDSEQQEY